MRASACMSARGGVRMARGDDRASSSTASLLLPPGFRFCPTDGELVAHYLARKAADAGFTSAAIRDVDLYSAEPWDLLPPR
ncbi:hypothetical protein E2562_039145 [Oryza meyeriana var. granulata]|uniref:NAC domain-containing protein n=1 Tax=Oryza meyeriana var. granulata TaxID=110450 RepID=A0A6G1DTU9_9ORYZ|nr:hypothetical protein E2562_039145 [Oryza meyeriana var. granulata]